MMSDRHFQGNGIRLRAPEPEDLEVMFRFENATDVWEMSNTTGPYSRFQLKQYIEQTQNDLFADRQLRLMIENGNRQVVGMVDVCSFDPLHNRAEVGIMVDKSCRRQGIGRNALALLEEHCFRYLGIHQLFAYIAVEPSFPQALCGVRVQRECGIERVGAYVWRWIYRCAGCPEAESQLREGYWG